MAQIIAGIHAVKHALEAGEKISELLIEKGKDHPRINELIHLARKAKINVSFVPKAALERLSDGAQHQGVVARAASREVQDFKSWLEQFDADDGLVLLLDQVTDPHNIGACLRTAEAAGCAAVIVPKDQSGDLNSPIVAKTACGAASRLPVMSVTNLVRAMEALQKAGFWISGLAGEAEQSVYDVDLRGKTAIVMGAEGSGLRRLVREQCDQLVKIPMPGVVESLNVSVATGVALFEVVRQRRS